MKTQEIECRFLEIDKDALIKKLLELGAKDEGEKMLEETIIYDPELTWRGKGRFIRVRKNGDDIKLTYKNHIEHGVGGTVEIEFGIDDAKKAEALFENIGFVPYRHQQKKRHTFRLGEVIVDIDTWPRIPAYVELEGESKEVLRDTAQKLGFDWKDVEFHNAGWVIENIYKIQVTSLRWFTFDRFE